jgi:hypothetical protein
MLEDICRHVLAFSSNFFGSITHRGGRDARVPVRRRFAANVVGYADVWHFGFADACPAPVVGYTDVIHQEISACWSPSLLINYRSK